MAIGLYLVLGLFSGFIAGLFGVGGGLIIVPALLWAFSVQGYDPIHLTHVAVGTSLATIIVTSISSVNAHHRRGAVRWPTVRLLAGGLLLGSFLGAAVAKQLSAPVLQFTIGVFAFWVAYSMFRGAAAQAARAEQLPPAAQQVAAGGVIGLASAIFGIGGGSLTVPYLSRYGVPMQQAVATSSACGLPIALAGALGFMWFGQGSSHLPAGSWGFVNIYAFLGISVGSVLSAQWGAKLAHRLPAAQLKKYFSLLLFVVGVVFVARSMRGF